MPAPQIIEIDSDAGQHQRRCLPEVVDPGKGESVDRHFTLLQQPVREGMIGALRIDDDPAQTVLAVRRSAHSQRGTLRSQTVKTGFQGQHAAPAKAAVKAVKMENRPAIPVMQGYALEREPGPGATPFAAHFRQTDLETRSGESRFSMVLR